MARDNGLILLKRLKEVLTNKYIFYIGSRYLTYGLQFVNSILIAIYLGPYYLGVWGFILLVIQYFAQMNFGISHSVNTIIALNKNRTDYVIRVTGAGLWLIVGVSFFIGSLFLSNDLAGDSIGDKYNFSHYSLIVYLTIALGYFDNLFMNIFRVYGKVQEIAFSQSAFPILSFASLLLFSGNALLWILTVCYLLSFIMSLTLFIWRSPVRISFSFDFKLAKLIQSKGWHLFLYNSSFYLIVISTRFFISGYYTVQEFGFFTFAFSLANAILLLLQSVYFLIFPKMLNRFAHSSTDEISSVLKTIREAYISVSHLLVHLAILVFPYFVMLFPQYEESVFAFQLIALTVVLFTNSFGYQGLLIAKSFEKKLGFISVCAFLFNILIVYAIVRYGNVEYYQVVLGTLLTYLLYVFTVGYFGRKILGLSCRRSSIVKDVFPLTLFVPYFASCILVMLKAPSSIFSFVPFVLFVLLNHHKFKSVIGVLKNVVKNPKVMEI